MIRTLLISGVLLIAGCNTTETPVATETPLQPQPSATSEPGAPPTPGSTVPLTETDLPAPPLPTSDPVELRPAFSLDFEVVIASGFRRPVQVTHAGDGSGRLFVVEQRGRIFVIENRLVLPAPFLDIGLLVDDTAFERGLLSVAFDPDYASNGFFYVNYTRKPDGATSIERFHVSNDPNVADVGSRQTVLVIDQPERNHNGGMSAFGPDGFLYIGTGDGGGSGDRHGDPGNGQSLDTLLGKMLRIDVRDESTYAIPATNPFAESDTTLSEIWAYGLRNPWRFSFDRETGDLYIGDVGQNDIEEVSFQSASSAGGENYGWRIMEGFACFAPSTGCDQSGLTLPISQYLHDQGCSITGGYVYRGRTYPWLDGLYFFADYCSGIIWTVEAGLSGEQERVRQGQADFRVSSFGEDEEGELYIVAHDEGQIYRLTSTSP